MSLNKTTRGNRLHISIFGRTNSGKSSLINSIVGHKVSLVSDMAGTTTDAVYKSMELHPIGPVVFVDTAGFADGTALGQEREKLTKEVIKKTDIAILLFDEYDDLQDEMNWYSLLKESKLPTIFVVSKGDIKNRDELLDNINDIFGEEAILVKGFDDENGLSEIKKQIENNVDEDFKRSSILKNLIGDGELALLVMPQDIQAPKGRLILPQVQTIRELLDKKATVVSTTMDMLDTTLKHLVSSPKIIITDSQCFKDVMAIKPKDSLLTSFSVLFAAYKGDIETFIKGAKTIGSLSETSKVLIAEACTHAPLEEDIGRVKIPKMLRKRFGQSMEIDIVSGSNFSNDIKKYDLIIHCGACMFNRRYMMSRVDESKKKAVPMTNYGVAIAYLQGILDDVVY